MLLIEPHYFPCIQYFAKLIGQDCILLEGKEHYLKQTYRNRCYILAANKTDRLSIPINKITNHTPIQDVTIDYSQRWQNIHLRAISSAYSNAPFFDVFIDDIQALILQKHHFLIDLNIKILTLCLKYLRLNIPIDITSVYQKEYEKNIVDLRNKISPDNQEIISAFPTYQQIFGNSFVSNLSILDLLFCEGNQAYAYLTNCNKVLNF
jgi:hypothetical protein